ncbi:MAG: hypothetical protein TU36_006300 [Vulcanisaeta sp. AZ3]
MSQGEIVGIAIIIVVIIAIIMAVLYRLGYLGSKRGRSEDDGKSEPKKASQLTSQYVSSLQPSTPSQPTTREVPAGQGERAVLIESRPLEVRPVQKPERSMDIERIERIIKDIENELTQVIKQSSMDAADLLLTRIGELRSYIDKLVSQCTMQYPPFVQTGYIPSSTLEFKELFGASFVGLLRNNEMLEYVGEPNPDYDFLKSLLSHNTDFVVIYYEGKYLYLIKYNNYSLALATENYLDPMSGGLLKLLFRRFVDEILTQQGQST